MRSVQLLIVSRVTRKHKAHMVVIVVSYTFFLYLSVRRSYSISDCILHGCRSALSKLNQSKISLRHVHEREWFSASVHERTLQN